MPRKARYTAEDIVGAAFQLVREGGWQNLSATAVGERLGCSTMPIYSHFKNMDDLEEAVLERAWSILIERETEVVTGDPWVDQAIAYTRFAREEKHLFLCMFDGSHQDKSLEQRMRHWEHLAGQLEHYEPFADLDDDSKTKIRMSRAMFSHGISSAVIGGWFRPLEDEEFTNRWIHVVSRSILAGMKEIMQELGETLPTIKTDRDVSE